MAASRSMLEALLARVQRRANEPRPASLSPVTLAADGEVDTTPRHEVAEEDIEEYDEELIEIIDDADVIPRAAAAARAIEPAAFGATLDRRSGAPAQPKGAASIPSPAVSSTAAPSAAAAPNLARGATSPTAAPAAGVARPGARPASLAPEPLRAESVAPRPIAATDIARTRGTRRELRSSPFLDLLDASLKLGS